MMEYEFMERFNSDHGTTQQLAIMLTTVGSMVKWNVEFFGATRGMSEEERFHLFGDAVRKGATSMNLDGVEWEKLYDFAKVPFGKEL